MVFLEGVGIAIPGDNHVAVHVLELVLGGLEGVWRGVELICLETLVAQVNGEGLVILLDNTIILSATSLVLKKYCASICRTPRARKHYRLAGMAWSG
jgi:hypothetical protein